MAQAALRDGPAYFCERTSKTGFRKTSIVVSNHGTQLTEDSVRITTPNFFISPQPGCPLFNSDGEVFAIADFPTVIDGQEVTPWILVFEPPGSPGTVGLHRPN